MQNFKNWLEAKRRFKQHKLLKESYESQTGIYWWIVMPKGEKDYYWDIMKYFDSEYPDVQHDGIWRTEVSSFLISAWKKRANFDLRTLQQFKNAYSGLPRGRISKGTKGYLLLHGNDSPAKKNNKKIITAEFGLSADLVTEQFDEHETMLPQDTHLIQSLLGIEW